MAEQVPQEILARLEAGDERAADELFEQYVSRLIPLARSRMSKKLSRRVDADDVVQSAFRSFFKAAKEGRFVLERSGDLWRLLAAITVNKVRKQAVRQRAAKRSIDSEQSFSATTSSLGIRAEAVAHVPTPAEATALAEELHEVMQQLLPLHREMLERRLNGESITQISTATKRTEHQVRRVIKKVRDELEARFRAE